MSDFQIIDRLEQFCRGQGKFKYNKNMRRIENGAGQLIDESLLVSILNAVSENAKKRYDRKDM